MMAAAAGRRWPVLAARGGLLLLLLLAVVVGVMGAAPVSAKQRALEQHVGHLPGRHAQTARECIDHSGGMGKRQHAPCSPKTALHSSVGGEAFCSIRLRVCRACHLSDLGKK
jgi:hypothetical protein